MTTETNKSTPFNSKNVLITVGILLAVAAGVFFFTKSDAAMSANQPANPAFGEYIAAYTGGIVSKETTIRIRLAQEIQDSTLVGKEVGGNLFRFDPSVKGKAMWVDTKTIEFQPDGLLNSGTTYQVKFKLTEVMDVPDNFDLFEFSFQTITQNYEIDIAGLKYYDITNLKKQKLIGTLTTADIATAEEVEKILSATQSSKALKITWSHATNKTSHEFVVENIARSKHAGKVALEWNGKHADMKNEGMKEIEIPALGDFKLTNSLVMQSPEQYLSLQFSDPLQQKQNLRGLIDIENLSGTRFLIDENEIRVYPTVRQTGEKKVSIYAGIRNILKFKMKKDTTISATFEQIKPAVRFTGKGVILPSTDGMVMPFEAVNLKAVKVKIIRIYEKNVAQFLQVNTLYGEQELKRVGKPIAVKILRLDKMGVADLGKWNRFTLDLSSLIKTEPGAIYQIQLNLQKSFSIYDCQDGSGSDEEEELSSLDDENWDEEEAESSSWDNYEENNYYNNYRWQERDNPCDDSYYSYGNRNIKQNILASDLGIIAKRGNDGQVTIAITDLKTTAPISNVTVEVLDYQQDVIGSAITDKDGFGLIETKRRKPFLIIAKRGDERGYLKVDDGSSLSLSNFDVSGSYIQKGIKGFIYGERGVWRPGDPIFLTFVLEDKNETLPKNHPVSFELINPQGQVIDKKIKSTAVHGMYHFATSTEEEAITGNWSAVIKVGGATFVHPVKIETIKPNRLKINLDFGKERIMAGEGDIQGKLNVKWLHGAPARNLKAEFDVTLVPTTTSFSKYAEYAFDDPSRDFYAQSQTIFEGFVDDDGNATIDADLSTNSAAPGALTAHFKGKVFEEGGGYSIDRFSIPYYPYQSFIGVRTPKGDRARGMLLTDTTHVVNIATVDQNGNPISRSNVNVQLYKLEWRWWWDNSSDNISNYIGRTESDMIFDDAINTKNGRGTWKFKIKYPEWGRYFVRVTDPISGHSSGKIIYLDWPGWAGKGQRESPGGASMLSFAAEKDKYEVGEDVKISIPSSGKGRALVSIENGSTILKKFWVETQQGETPFQFTVTEEMAPNIYVNVSLLQPHSQTANDLPIRLYGITAIEVNDPGTHLSPVLSMPNTLEPEQKVTLKISEANGKAMAYTVAVVDEGLLDLTKFTAPNPWNSFYGKEALGVKTWDIYEDVIGAYGGKLERLLAIGGDEEGGKEETTKTNRFKPVVKFLGPFFLEKGKTVTHTFTMPQYIGSVKTMVVAAKDGAYGSTEKATPVRQALMVLGTLPRVLGPGESVRLPANVFVNNAKIKNVNVKVETSNLFTLTGNSKQNLSFASPTDKIVDFNLKVGEQIGTGNVKIVAKSGSKTATYDFDITIRNPNPPITKVIEHLIPAGKSWNTDFTNVGMIGTNSGVLEVYTIPPINMEKRLRYLIQYPHGCVEQTVSSVFPQLFLSDVMDISETAKKRIQRNVAAGITKLKSFQNSDGSFSYWPGGSDFHHWGTSYAGHFLVEAKNKGYNVPDDMLKRWKKSQHKAARNWRKDADYYNDDLNQAYRLYGLALADSPEKGAMNRLREKATLNKQAKWRLAAAYVLAGQPEAAKALVSGISTDIKPYNELSNTFGSNSRDEAMILETLCLMGDKVKGFSLMKKISASLSRDNYWMSTQTTAYSLIAAAKFIELDKPEGGINFSYQLNSSKTITATTDMPIASKALTVDGWKSGKINIQNKGKSEIYARLILVGTPVTGDQTSASNNLKLNIIYKNMDGKVISPDNLAQGTNFVAEVTVANPGLRGNYKEMALTQIFPSGWEIVNTRMDEVENQNSKDKPTYQDIRDDRVLTYFDLKSNERKTFKILLNASYAGRFYLPTISCEAMYDNTINAHKAGKWVTVGKDGVQ